MTTSHDPSNDTQTVFTKSEMQRAGWLLGPRLYSTGTILYGAETAFKAVVENYEDALMHIRRMKAAGAISVKSYNQQRRDTRQMFLKAAREQGLMVVPEGGSLLYQNLTMITDGHTGIEHSLPVPKLYRDVRHAVLEDQGRLHADADRGLRRPDGRELLVSARRRVAERAAAGVHAARHAGRSDRAAGRWPRRTTSTTCSSPAAPRR